MEFFVVIVCSFIKINDNLKKASKFILNSVECVLFTSDIITLRLHQFFPSFGYVDAKFKLTKSVNDNCAKF